MLANAPLSGLSMAIGMRICSWQLLTMKYKIKEQSWQHKCANYW
jgi:hypothetical protein